MRVLLLGLFLLCSCAGIARVDSEKFDTPLRQKLKAMDANDTSDIPVIVKCSQAVDSNMKSTISGLGVTVRTVTGKIFTASASSQSLNELAQLTYVTQIQLSDVRQRKF